MFRLYLNKILPLFFSPIVVVLGLLLVSLVFRKRSLGFTALMVLLIASLPVFADRLLLLVQGSLVRLEPSQAVRSDAVVVLAGSLKYTKGSAGPVAEWGSSVDRIFAGIELMQADRAERMVFSSGDYVDDDLPSEGELARELAKSLGIEQSRIILSAKASTTADEARLIRPLFTSVRPTIILVTSASHMPRAEMIFAEAGFAVTPFPVDIDIPIGYRWYEGWLPTARGLMKTDIAIREAIGQGYYKLVYLFR